LSGLFFVLSNLWIALISHANEKGSLVLAGRQATTGHSEHASIQRGMFSGQG
jgi:hypothetical protein